LGGVKGLNKARLSREVWSGIRKASTLTYSKTKTPLYIGKSKKLAV
jgi:hypothetical protein